MDFIRTNDKEAFNDFVNNSNIGHIHQTFDWGDIKAKFGWEQLRYIVTDNGRIKAAISLLKTKKKGFTIMYASRGPALDYSDKTTLDFTLTKLQELAKKEKVLFLRISPAILATNENISKQFKTAGFFQARNPQQHTSTITLDLANKTPEELIAGFGQKTRYNIRLSAKKGIIYKKCSNENEINDFYTLLQKMSKRQDYELTDIEYFKTIYKELVQKKMAELYFAYKDDKLIGGLFNLHFADKSWYMWGAFDYEYRNLMANYGLHWEGIKDAISKNIKTYDFQGIPKNPTPSNPMWGFYRFKKGFNGQEINWLGEFDMPGKSKLLYKIASILRLV